MKDLNNYILEKLKINKDSMSNYIVKDGEPVLLVSLYIFTHTNKHTESSIQFYEYDEFNKTTLEGNFRAVFKLNKEGYLQLIENNNPTFRYLIAMPINKAISFMENTILKYEKSGKDKKINKEDLLNYFDEDIVNMPEEVIIDRMHTQRHLENTLEKLKNAKAE